MPKQTDLRWLTDIPCHSVGVSVALCLRAAACIAFAMLVACAKTTAAAPVQKSFFGMHVASLEYEPWPTVPFSALRLWDTWPGASWMDLAPTKAKYDWSNLDKAINIAVARNVDIVYTFGYVPSWASSNPSANCDGAPVGSCYVPNITAWKAFVTAITARYKDKVKYWEIWNEPNASNFWRGTPAQLADMARVAYPIIKAAGGKVLSPAPQGTNSHVWLASYFSAGGVPYTDIVAFHGYLYGAPELITPLAANLRSLMSAYGIADRPLWDTEHSWGDNSWPFGSSPSLQAAWLARFIALSLSSQIDRSFWYMWDSFSWGSLFDRRTRQLLVPGIAYREVYSWLTNADMSPCTNTADLYECEISRSGGYKAIMVWSTSNQLNYAVPSGFTGYRTLTGSTGTIGPSGIVPVSKSPILLERSI